MTIRFKICFQLDPLPFCSSPIPLQVCQEANQLSHSRTRSPAASRAKATEREEMSSSHREALKAARQPSAPGRPGKGPPRSQLCPLCSCRSLERSALGAKPTDAFCGIPPGCCQVPHFCTLSSRRAAKPGDGGLCILISRGRLLEGHC